MPAAIDDNTELKPYEYENCKEILYCEENENCGKEKTSLASLLYADFYVIGKIWIGALRTILVGAKLTLIPTVQAATVHAASVKEPCPPKPPKMKHTDLPIYDCPHKTYKDHLEDKEGCPQQEIKILHMIIQPHVKVIRTSVQSAVCSMRCEAINSWNEIACDVKKAKKDTAAYLKDPANENFRKGFVVAGTGLGFYKGSGRGLPRKIFWTGFGAATAGMLCFPKETDVVIRDFCFYTAQTLLTAYNFMLNKNVELPGKVPCSTDLPTEPKYKKKILPCVPPKEK